MVRNISYSSWLIINVNHSYFNTNRCDLDIVPSKDTKSDLSKLGFIFKQFDACTWILLKPSNQEGQISLETLFDDNLIIQFDVKNRTSDFYYYTEVEQMEKHDYWGWNYIGRNGVYGQIYIHITKKILKEKTEIKLDLKSKVKCCEFILIHKFNTNININALKLVESKKRLSFSFVGEVLIPGEIRTALRFISDETHRLTESYDFKIDLWEIKNNGDYLLGSSIPYPKPQSISIFNPENTITSYYYF